LMLKLSRDELDIVVGRLPPDLAPQAFDYETLVDEQPVHVVARPSHPWHQRQTMTWNELAQALWIMPPQGSLMRLKFESLFVQQKIMPPQRLVETQDLDTIRRLLSQTDMVAVLTDEVAKACESAQVPCVSKLLPLQMQGFGLITKHGRALSNSVNAMKTILKAMGQAQYSIQD
jgi:DNA-binding transcriptional LysR family regulator